MPAPGYLPGRPQDCTDANAIDGNGVVSVVFERMQKDDPKTSKTEILVLRTWPNYDISQDRNFRLCVDSTQNNNVNTGLASGAVRTACVPFLGREFQPGHKDVCVRTGSTVKFRLINATSEIPNFHIHQAKFTVTQFTSAPGTGNSSFDAVNQATQQRTSGETQFKNIDSIPVLPAQVAADGTVNHMVDLNVRFDRPEQVGSFVFHCHILEHEDKGMMNTITIFD